MADFDHAIGRYVHLDVEGTRYRVYFEESGATSGIPLLLQHTAGSDARQWRHFLENEAVREHFRMIAYDLPYHGKSVPPDGWWEREYKLTKSFLLSFVTTLASALGLESPVYMGSSIGGHLALDLALHHPQRFQAVIGLEAAAKSEGGDLTLQNDPRVSNEFKAATMYGLTAPQAPERWRREVAWGYSQGAPRVFEGDLNYWSIDHDMTDGSAAEIDTSQVAVYLLTGEYDAATPPVASAQVAEQIPGAIFREMKGLGHFPMSEDPDVFYAYLEPVLEEIRARRREAS